MNKLALFIVMVLVLIGVWFSAPIEDVYVCSDPKAHTRPDGVFDCRSWIKTKKLIWVPNNV